MIVRDSLQTANFDAAAGMALDGALLYPKAAHDMLTAAMAGAAKHNWTRVVHASAPSDATLPQWLYIYWHRWYCKKGDVSLPHDTAASLKHYGSSA